MLEIETKRFIFKKKNIWFSDSPFDVKGCSLVVFYVCKNKIDFPGAIPEESPTIIIDLTQNLDTIWKNIEQRTRRYIKRAEKEGIEIRLNENFKEFNELYYRFVSQKGFESFGEDLNIMRRYGTILNAYKDNELIAGLLTIEDHIHIRILVGASKRFEGDKKMSNLVSWANRALIWEAMRLGKEKGCKVFDLGGYYTGGDKNDPRYNINLFKLKFGGNIVTYYKYIKYYSMLYKFIKTLLKKEKAL
ncbi:MAG: peptidoglycan bridge formation glycyltransferase FemA/FemB family protein [Desulfonauticus sp.]|nr:peptidoglycan bridge formation glycyltransferase FemA/FemB family protein [Desulfonauticus sp.]